MTYHPTPLVKTKNTNDTNSLGCLACIKIELHSAIIE